MQVFFLCGLVDQPVQAASNPRRLRTSADWATTSLWVYYLSAPCIIFADLQADLMAKAILPPLTKTS